MFTGKPKVKVSTSGVLDQQKIFIYALNHDVNKTVKKVKQYLQFFATIYQLG